MSKWIQGIRGVWANCDHLTHIMIYGTEAGWVVKAISPDPDPECDYIASYTLTPYYPTREEAEAKLSEIMAFIADGARDNQGNTFVPSVTSDRSS